MLEFRSLPPRQKVSAFVKRSAQDFKFAANQRNIGTQYNFGFCLQKGEGVPVDLGVIADHFKLAVDQSFPEAK
jgi:TPR repeat protein